MKPIDIFVLAWIGFASLAAFLLFGLDKWRARKSGERVPELHLALIAGAGGWIGGLIGMWLFRHKTLKGSFQLKFGAAFIVFACAIGFYLFWRQQ